MEEPIVLEETTESVAIPNDRPFLTTALNEYSVTEGLLLLIALLLLCSFVAKLVRGCFP